MEYKIEDLLRDLSEGYVGVNIRTVDVSEHLKTGEVPDASDYPVFLDYNARCFLKTHSDVYSTTLRLSFEDVDDKNAFAGILNNLENTTAKSVTILTVIPTQHTQITSYLAGYVSYFVIEEDAITFIFPTGDLDAFMIDMALLEEGDSQYEEREC